MKIKANPNLAPFNLFRIFRTLRAIRLFSFFFFGICISDVKADDFFKNGLPIPENIFRLLKVNQEGNNISHADSIKECTTPTRSFCLAQNQLTGNLWTVQTPSVNALDSSERIKQWPCGFPKCKVNDQVIINSGSEPPQPEKKLTWWDADAYCKRLKFLDKTWQLPTPQQFHSLFSMGFLAYTEKQDDSALLLSKSSWNWGASHSRSQFKSFQFDLRHGYTFDGFRKFKNHFFCVTQFEKQAE